MKSFNTGWYLMYTKPRHEKKVHSRLSEMNITSFLPMKKQLQVWQNKKTYTQQPLFPSYLFIYLNSMQHYYHGMDTEGCLYYVKTGKEMAKVSETVIENIKLVVNMAKELEVSEKRFEAGRKLVITNGPFTGLCCEVVKTDNKDKLLVRVDLLQRNIILTLPEDHLMAME